MANPNYNLIKFIRRNIYQMKREYGGSIQINILGAIDTDLKTGVKSAVQTSYDIARAVVLPVRYKREVIQTISMISANKKFVQGGLFETGTRSFIIDRRDCPSLTAINNEDWIVYDGKRYEIKWIDEFEQGTAWLLIGKELEGAQKNEVFTPSAFSVMAMADTATYTICTSQTYNESANSAMVLGDAVAWTMDHTATGNDAMVIVDSASASVVSTLLTANGAETFNGVSTKSGGTATLWTMGDGTDITNNTADHTYAGVGTYTVKWDASAANINTLNTSNSGVTSITTHNTWTGLTELDVQDNAITSLTTHLEWVNLEKLLVSRNTISTLTTHAEWTALTDIECDLCGLSSLTLRPEWTNLVNVVMSRNTSITSVTTHVEWTALETFDADNCDLTAFTPREEWTALKHLYLGDNSLTSITTYGWTNLETFDVNNNSPLTNPILWGTWNSIKYIDLSSCAITSFNTRAWSTIEHLDLASNAGLTTIVTQSAWTALTFLNVSSTGITGFVTQSAWAALEDFNIGNCSFSGSLNTYTAWTSLVSFKCDRNSGLTATTVRSGWTALAKFWAFNCALSVTTVPAIAALLDIRMQNNSLTAATIDTILINCDSGGGTGGSLNYSSNPGSADGSRSGAAATAKSNLVSKGWTVTS